MKIDSKTIEYFKRRKYYFLPQVSAENQSCESTGYTS